MKLQTLDTVAKKLNMKAFMLSRLIARNSHKIQVKISPIGLRFVSLDDAKKAIAAETSQKKRTLKEKIPPKMRGYWVQTMNRPTLESGTGCALTDPKHTKPSFANGGRIK